MTTSQLKFLADPTALQNISRALLTEFLNRFKDVLGSSHLPLLRLDLPPGDFFALLAALLASPEALPAPMRPR
jgi:hypothetical protein